MLDSVRTFRVAMLKLAAIVVYMYIVSVWPRDCAKLCNRWLHDVPTALGLVLTASLPWLGYDSDDMSRVFGFDNGLGIDCGSCFGCTARAMTCPGCLAWAVEMVFTVALVLHCLIEAA